MRARAHVRARARIYDVAYVLYYGIVRIFQR